MGLLITLAVAALATSALSGVLGMGGGALLLAVMLTALPWAEVIPLHAVVQLASNGTRVLAYLPQVSWPVVVRFAAGLLPGGLLGALLIGELARSPGADPWLKLLVGAWILVMLVIPEPASSPRDADDGEPSNDDSANGNVNDNPLQVGHWWDWPALGFVAGSCALAVGAVGPLIAPLFLRRPMTRQQVVATKAVCQSLLHLVKLPVFVTLWNFDYARSALLLAVLVACVVPGTLIGRRLLARHVSESLFRRMYRLALLLAGSKVLIADGLLPLLA
jgi:uncharacterized membrane protein YfcA